MALTTSAHQIISQAQGSPAELPDAFWEIVERYRSELVNQAFAIVGNLQEAEDVAQETLVAAYAQSEKTAQVRSLSAWLRSINHNGALNRWRNRNRDAEKVNGRQRRKPGKGFTTGGFTALEIKDSVAKAMDELPENLRSPLLLRYWEHLSCEQIAQRLDRPVGTIKWQLGEATVRMHGTLKKYFVAEAQEVEGQQS